MYADIAVAAQVGCGWCLDFGYFQAQNQNLDMAKVSHVTRWRASDVFTPLERDDPMDLLFTAPRGGPLRASNFRQRVWRPAIQRASAKGYTARELRQVVAALMREAGADEHEVSVKLQHTHPATSSDVYGGITAERHEAMDRAIAGLVAARRVKRGSTQSDAPAG